MRAAEWRSLPQVLALSRNLAGTQFASLPRCWGCSTYAGRVTNSASLAATFAIVFSAVFSPFREASMGLMSRRASYVVLCTTGMS